MSNDPRQNATNEHQKKELERYLRAMHAMQTGVKWEAGYPDGAKALEPKQLRVGVNSALTSTAALYRILLAKGLVTVDEYYTAQADTMEDEARAYEERLSKLMGTEIKLH